MVVDTEAQTEPSEEGVRVVPVMAPFQFGAMKPQQSRSGQDCPVLVLLAQGGWAVQAQFNQSDALDFARRIRQAVKEARGGIVAAHAPLLGANGAPISVPTAELDDLDDDDEDPSKQVVS